MVKELEEKNHLTESLNKKLSKITDQYLMGNVMEEQESQIKQLRSSLKRAEINLVQSKQILANSIDVKLEYEKIILSCLKRSSIQPKVMKIIQQVN